MANPYHLLPSISKLLERPEVQQLQGRFSHDDIANALRHEVEQLRAQITQGTFQEALAETSAVLERATRTLEQAGTPKLRTVINATGIVLHTNLGRSPMHETAATAAYEAARGYLNLELELATGKRSSRQDPIREDVCRITGAEAATVVNNCAAATVIVLRTLAFADGPTACGQALGGMAVGKEVIVSRGQLIEIGGSFRIPDILKVSGATLREVGTTNITRAADYENAVSPQTGAIMRIHTSNYRVRGFTKSATIEELVAIAQKHKIPLIDDAGSGASVDFAAMGLPGEPHVSEGIKAGADLVLFSGDKLLGGPQAGIIAGKKSWIAKIEKDPLMRAFRLDKMTLAALEATLRLYRDPAKVTGEVPTLKMLSASVEQLRVRCERLAEQLRPLVAEVQILDDVAYVGGGSLPDQAMPTVVLAITAKELSVDELSRRLRTGTPAVMGRIQDGKLLLDLRTVFERQEESLIDAIRRASE